MIEWDELLVSVESFLGIAAAAVAGLVVLWLAVPALRRRLLPLPRRRRVRWTGREVLLAFLNVLFVPAVAVDLLNQAGFFERFLDPAPDASVRVIQQMILSTPLTLPLVLALVVTLLYARTQARPKHYGLTRTRWPQNLALGLVAFLVLTPPLLGFYALLRQVSPVEQHPVELLVQSHTFAPWLWPLLLLQVSVAAPLVEELLYRGVLQGWLHRASNLGHHVFVVFTLLAGLAHMGLHPGEEGSFEIDNLGPPVFAGVLVVGYAALRTLGTKSTGDGERDYERGERRADWVAVYGSAMFWAVSHSAVWPSPLPLFPFGLVLGWMARRSQSLIGPIVCHALFNGVSFVMLYVSAAT